MSALTLRICLFVLLSLSVPLHRTRLPKTRPCRVWPPCPRPRSSHPQRFRTRWLSRACLGQLTPLLVGWVPDQCPPHHFTNLKAKQFPHLNTFGFITKSVVYGLLIVANKQYFFLIILYTYTCPLFFWISVLAYECCFTVLDLAAADLTQATPELKSSLKRCILFIPCESQK